MDKIQSENAPFDMSEDEEIPDEEVAESVTITEQIAE